MGDAADDVYNAMTDPQYEDGDYPEEGDPCLECAFGTMRFYSANCSCHLHPPCGSCTEGVLKCDKCGATWKPDRA